MNITPLLVAGLIWTCHVTPLRAQSMPYQSTTAPPQARYEILTDPGHASTYRLNRYTGRVDRLVVNANGKSAWQEMQIFDRPFVSNDRPRFQLVTSAPDGTERTTLLVDTDNGKTWRVEDDAWASIP